MAYFYPEVVALSISAIVAACAGVVYWRQNFLSIRYACPHCAKTFRSPTELAGKQDVCPRCQYPCDVPKSRRQKADEMRRANQETQRIRSEASARQAAAQAKAAEPTVRNCEQCKGVIGCLEAAYAINGRVLCRKCRDLRPEPAATDRMACENCRCSMDRRDEVHVFKGHTVCPECQRRLSEAAPKLGEPTVETVSGLSTTALIFGVLGFLVPICAVLAIVCGLVAKHDGLNPRTKSRAETAMHLGIYALIFWFFVTIVWIACIFAPQ